MTEQTRNARMKAWKRQKGICFYCGVTVAKHKATLDHRIPLSEGGTLADDNAAMACHECNNAKGNMPESVFRAGPEAQRAWRWEQAERWRTAYRGEMSEDSLAQYGALIGKAAYRARAMAAVKEARGRRSGE